MPDYSKHSLGPEPPKQPDVSVEPSKQPDVTVEPSKQPVIPEEPPVQPVIPEEPSIQVNNPINKPKKNAEWFFSTNTDNMRLIISQGLIPSPDGFSKYYEDVLNDHNGVIPVFKDKVPSGVIDKNLSEENMVACIVKLNLELIEGSAYIKVDKGFKQIDISDCIEGNVSTFYVPSPIPASLIEALYFQSKDDRDRFKSDADSYSNVPLVNLTCSIKKTLFRKNKLPYYKPQENILNNPISLDYSRIYAFGGIAANLFYFAKNGTLSNELYKSFVHFKHEWSLKKMHSDYLNSALNAITSVIPIENSSEKKEIQKKLYYDLFEIIRGNRKHVKQNILSYLENFEGHKSFKVKSREVAKSLNDLDFSDKTIPELFDLSKGTERFLIMFFLRESSKDLIEFDDLGFDEEDLLILGIFFGCRDNFKNIPKFIREYKGLQGFISTQMANYAHQMIGSNITFKTPNQEPKTIMDLINNHSLKDYNKFLKDYG